MHIGALVSKKSRWGIDSQLIGIVVDKSNHVDDGWTVLWTLSDKRYKLQEHIGSALIDLQCIPNDLIEIRSQITT